MLLDDTAYMATAESSRVRDAAARAAHGYEPITTELRCGISFYYAEPFHRQYLQKVPNGYCGLGGTGVACPTAPGAAAS